MIEKLKEDLAKYRAELEGLNTKLGALEDQKQQIIKVGTRIEGVVAYLKKTIEDMEPKVNPIPQVINQESENK